MITLYPLHKCNGKEYRGAGAAIPTSNCASALKGHHIPAQGNTLGKRKNQNPSAQKGQTRQYFPFGRLPVACVVFIRQPFVRKDFVFLMKFRIMEAIVIEVKDQSDINFWLKLAKKTGHRAKSINTLDIEDSKLADLIEKGMKTKFVSRDSVMEILGRNT